ncbi:hypothetical protein COLO4_14519 [Corchorus olitorius]|uniref:F-box domain-containing protein n=1 Tax=Corchorus olitorius TaxID=93759 RepID=A0A1R3JRV7_9ROSI|nr:hypothetical protein COLO4_14519 [Corchorus olitorius]
MRDYSDLPQEVLVEILMRLAIEDLVKSTAVCKSWNSLIKDPTFISTHLGKILSSTNTQLLFFRLCTLRDPWSESGGGIDYSLRFDNKALDEYKQLSCPNIGGCALRVAGSYNGRRNLVLAFDVSEQDLTEIPLPDCLSYECGTAQLLKYGQSSIATMTWELREVHLWVMKEYAVATSWTKVLVVAEESVSRVLFFRNDEQVFVPLNGGWMASVDINTKHYEILGVESIGLMESYLVVDSYVESLVLLDKYCNAGWDVIPIKEDYYPNSTTNYVMDLFSWMDAA